MKNAIFVGRTRETSFRFVDNELCYGRTGEAEVNGSRRNEFKFYPDGSDVHPWICCKDEIYIPSEDQTRHCPKP